MGKPKVFVTRKLPELGMRMMAERAELDVWPEQLPPAPDVLKHRVQGCSGLVSLLTDRIDASVMDAAGPGLRVISNFAVGVNNIDLPAATKRAIAVGNTPGVLTEATADIAMTLLLAAARRLPESCEDAKAGRWKTWEPLGWIGQELNGRTLGIVGMGRIGLALAKRCRFGWGMNVVYTSRSPKPAIDKELDARRVELDALLGESQFVSVHCDLNETTKGLFGAKQFAMMRREAVFVNTSRGPVVDQSALADALRTGKIFAAGLDVTDPEPLPVEHELYKLPNCVIAPHIASATVDTRDAMAQKCAENLLAGLEGRPLTSCVNPEFKG